MIAPYRFQLRAGRAEAVWEQVKETTWPSQVLGPRWESVVRDHVARGGIEQLAVQAGDEIGTTTVADRGRRRSHEVDLVVARSGKVVAIGEAKLRRLGGEDLDRLIHIRELLNAPDAALVLASATGFDLGGNTSVDVITLAPDGIYSI